MKLDVLNPDKFILVNNCKEITNSVMFNLGSNPTDDGLFSYELFGNIGSDERKKNFGYIDLKYNFIHPLFYKMFIRMNRKLETLFNGTKYYSIIDGDIVEDNEKGKTGIKFFYDNYSKIKFKETDSVSRTDKTELLEKTKKSEIFQSKLIVIPAFLRDFSTNSGNSGNVVEKDIINDYYTSILRTVSNIDSEESILFSNTLYSIQKNINTIFEYLIGYISGKEGLIHKGVLGKSTDYTTRSVIITNRFPENSWKDNNIPITYTGIPLSQICTLFYPFMVKYINDFVEEWITEFSEFEDGKGNLIKVKNVKQQFSEEKIKKNIIESYIKDIEHRFDPITVEAEDGKKYPIKIYNKELNRPFSKIDILYLAAVDICKDKHVYITRYPLTNFKSIMPSKIFVLSTEKTMEIYLNDKFLKNYPRYEPEYPVDENSFKDATIMNSSYLKSLGADFDGKLVINNILKLI